MEYRFKSDEWNSLSTAERIRRSRLWAKEAHHLADNATPEMKAGYRRIAEQWTNLARDLERTSKGGSHLKPQ